MKLGCCTTMENYRTLCELGYDFIELSGYDLAHMTGEEVEAAAEQIAAYGTPCLALNAYCRDKLPMVGPGFNREAARTYAAHLCSRAARLGVKTLGIGAPAARRLPRGYDLELADSQMRAFLQITAREAAPYGIWVLFEPLNPTICEYGLSTGQGAELVRSAGESNIGLVVDYHHMALTGETMDQLGGALPLTRHLHINHVGADKRKHYLLESETPLYRRQVESAVSQGYSGALSIETELSENDFREDAGRSLRILRQALQAL